MQGSGGAIFVGSKAEMRISDTVFDDNGAVRAAELSPISSF